MTFLWHGLAHAEYVEALDYYFLLAGPAVARKFSTAVNETLRLVEEHPEIGVEAYGRARRFPVHGFLFHLVYRTQTDVIVAVASQRRRPGYWGGRRLASN